MKKTYLIGNAHLDPVWLWRWSEGLSEVRATFRSALDRMDEFPDFKFTCGCAAYYMWIEKIDPVMFSEIKQRVAEGRWCIVGGGFIQPDCNLPSGEGFARQALIGQRYFYEKFGVICKTGYNVDSFGHNGNLPKILKNSGMENYVFMRPMKNEKPIAESLFEWESSDGSCVTTFRVPESYCLTDVDKIKQNADFDGRENSMMVFYGVGNHGGGATVELLNGMHEGLDESFIYSTPEEYFAEIASSGRELPLLKNDDLQFHAKGCYSAHSEAKKLNRMAENAAVSAEIYTCLSDFLTADKDGMHLSAKDNENGLGRAWNTILFNHFHDILGGCCAKMGMDDAVRSWHGALTECELCETTALQRIAAKIDTALGNINHQEKLSWPPTAAYNLLDLGTPIVVFNPHPFPVKTPLRLNDNAMKILDEERNEVKIQHILSPKACGNTQETLFTADVPPLGYRVYRMFATQVVEPAKLQEKPKATTLENGRFCVRFCEETGEISTIFDKQNGKELLKSTCESVLLDESHCDTWAHGIKEFKTRTFDKVHLESIELTEDGAVRRSVKILQKIGSSLIERTYSITPDCDEITVKCRVDFNEKHKMLKFRIAADVDHPRALCSIPFGHIERPTDGTEQPMSGWCAVTGDNGGIGIANNAKYSFDCEGGSLGLTVARGALYADHSCDDTRDIAMLDEICEFIDERGQEFCYSVFPFTSPHDATRRADLLNTPPTVLVESFHEGSLPQKLSGIELSHENIALSALKPRYGDSASQVLRLYETDGLETDAEIMIFGRKISAHFKPYQIKTLILSGREICESDFLEL